jgi:hypothetical protein
MLPLVVLFELILPVHAILEAFQKAVPGAGAPHGLADQGSLSGQGCSLAAFYETIR